MPVIFHTADFHIGAFGRTPFKEACVEAFKLVCDMALEERPDLVLICGDLFENPQPHDYAILSSVVRCLRALKEAGIPVYAVAGSHDSRARGETILNLFEGAGLLRMPPWRVERSYLVLSPIVDERTGTAIYGLPGMKREAERDYILRGLLVLEPPRDPDRVRHVIIMAHTSLSLPGIPSRYREGAISSDALTAAVRAQLDRFLPGRPVYYALGHVHLPWPLSGFPRASIAYAGAPVGRDWNDLYETKLLADQGAGRGFRLVILEEDGVEKNALVRLPLDLEVALVEVLGGEGVSPEDIVQRAVKAALPEALRIGRRRYPAVIVSIGGGLPDAFLKETIRRKVLDAVSAKGLRVLVHVKAKVAGSAEEEFMPIEVPSEFTLEKIEEEAFSKILGDKAQLGLELFRLFTSRIPAEGQKQRTRAELAEKALAILEKAFGVEVPKAPRLAPAPSPPPQPSSSRRTIRGGAGLDAWLG